MPTMRDEIGRPDIGGSNTESNHVHTTMSDEIGGPDIGGSNTDSNHVHTEEETGNDTTVVSISSSSTRQTSSEPNDTSFASVRIPTEEWKRRLQDGGCAKSALKKKTTKKQDSRLRSS